MQMPIQFIPMGEIYYHTQLIVKIWNFEGLTLLLMGCFLPFYLMAGGDSIDPLFIREYNRKSNIFDFFFMVKCSQIS